MAASMPCRSSACLSATVFIVWVCNAEPDAIGLMPAFRPSSLTWTIRVSPNRCAVASRNLIMSRNFHVVSTCKSENGMRLGWKALIAR